MEKKDVMFFKIISIIICLAVCIGVGSYVNNNHISQKDKNAKLINDMGLDQAQIDALEKLK